MKDPKKNLIALRVTAKELAALKKAARAAGISLSAYVMAPHRKKRKG